MSQAENRIEIRSINKRFGRIKALDDVSFSFSKGEIFGLLGPNGAGKTTLVRIMATLLNADSGSIEIFGLNTNSKRQKIRRLIGYVPASVILYPHLSAYENLFAAASLYKMSNKAATSRIEELLRKFDMWQWKDEKIKNFSTGMAQKINICRGILHDPQLLILDEPTNGLDPKSRQVVRDFVLDIREQGTTVLLTTHVMWSVEEICKRVAIIDKGKLVTIDRISTLKSEELKKQGRIKIFVKGFPGDKRNLKNLEAIEWITEINHEDKNDFVFTVDGNERVKEFQALLIKNFETIENIRINEPTLEDIFISLTKNQTSNTGGAL
ncbi:MAG TPA: ABC transporter ATP-binding protein [Thermotogota bacterium]|nr:ABC transporter ATP-binding protein [Thermotogota bacterium]HPJ88145.1 ABC transporter ATP-binding protein [Thermotogota bacterium]HPR95578.1 ABC transporter ATP-binding protein [Thermotogota bacterium]